MPKRCLLKFLVPSAAALFFILYYTVLYFGAKPQAIEKDIVHSLETLTSGTFKSEKFSLSYFPFLRPSFDNVSLEAKDPAVFTLKAKKIRFSFEFWGFLFGKANISRMNIDGGEIHIPMPARGELQTLDLSNIRLHAKMVKSYEEIHAKLESDFENVADALKVTMVLGIENGKKWAWDNSWFAGDAVLKNFQLKFFQQMLPERSGLRINQGVAAGTFHLDKKPRDPVLTVTGTANLNQFIYESVKESSRLVSPAIDSEASFEGIWNSAEELLFVKTLGMTSPLGKIQAGGKYRVATRELKDARLSVSGLRIESLAQYYPSFKEAIPFNLGFSGLSELEMSSEGTLDHLALHANWDLGATVLNYGDNFSKPKDMPLSLIFDSILKDGRNLSGDFSVKLQDAGIKGTITGLDFSTGEGQLNILTNKFLLDHWAPLFPGMKDYKMEGGIKILANMEGNLLQRPKEVKTMVNLTLEKAGFSKGNDSLSNIYLAMDYSPLLLEIKEAQVQAEGESPIFFNAMIYDPQSVPHAKVTVNSVEFDAARLFSSLNSLAGNSLTKNWKTFVSRAQMVLDEFLPAGQKVRQFTAELQTKDAELSIPKLQMEAYGGAVKLNGTVQTGGANAWHFETEIDHLNLARYYARKKDMPAVMNGNFFLKGTFDGTNVEAERWKEGFTGQGIFSVTNGEFNTFSLLKTVASVPGFSSLMEQSSNTTPFDDLRSDFKVTDGKFMTDNIHFLSRDAKGTAVGEINADGFLNYRIEAFISWELAKGVLSPFLGDTLAGVQEQSLGPVPLLLSGGLEQPELKTDPSKLAELTDNLAKQKVQKVLRNFLPEDVLFNRPKSS